MHNYMKTILSAVKTWANGRIDVRIKDSVADWNQNDSSADNYIKNRPFYEKDGVIHTIDSKYLPEEYATVNDIDIIRDAVDVAQDAADMAIANAATAQSSAEAAQTSAETAQTTADGKMNAANPVGSGSFSMNRLDNIITGPKSCAIGNNTIAAGYYSNALGCMTIAANCSQSVSGEYNIYEDIFSFKGLERKYLLFKVGETVRCSTDYSFDSKTGQFTLISPIVVKCDDLKNTYAPYRGYYFVSYHIDTVGDMVSASDSESGNCLIKLSTNDNYSSLVDWNDYNYYTRHFSVWRSFGKNSSRGIYANIIGNGTSDDERSNAHTLDWAGNAWYAGDVYVGSISGTNKDDGSKKLATEEYVQQSAKNYVILTDSINSYDYIVQMQDGNLTSICKTASISATAQPAKTEYVVGDTFDPAGMVIIATAQDGSTRVVENYTYTETLASGDTSVTITYIEAGVSYSTTVPVTVTE